MLDRKSIRKYLLYLLVISWYYTMGYPNGNLALTGMYAYTSHSILAIFIILPIIYMDFFKLELIENIIISYKCKDLLYKKYYLRLNFKVSFLISTTIVILGVFWHQLYYGFDLVVFKSFILLIPNLTAYIFLLSIIYETCHVKLNLIYSRILTIAISLLIYFNALLNSRTGFLNPLNLGNTTSPLLEKPVIYSVMEFMVLILYIMILLFVLKKKLIKREFFGEQI